MNTTIRVQKEDNDWLELKCIAVKKKHCTELYVPAWKGTWAITDQGMFGNTGGNDWRIYTLHPADCKRIIQALV